MSDYAFNYSFNITGNASTAAQQITGDVTALNNTVKQATGIWDSFAGKVVAFNQLSQFVEGFSRTVDETLAPGAALNASLADLSAISGETGESLKTIERYARDAAKTFGGSAAQSVESYKLLLSQLSPELAKTPDALKAMGDNIAVLSKTMGGDAKAAAEVLTTAMNQYGVSLADPMEASRKMAQMMNIPVLGLVENMAYMTCPDCGKRLYPFGEGRTADVAKQYGLPMLAQLPIQPELAKKCDEGRLMDIQLPEMGKAVDAVLKCKVRKHE